MSIFFPMIPLKPFPSGGFFLYVGVSNAGPYTCQVVKVDTNTDTVVANIPVTPPGTAFATISSLAITPDETRVFAQTSENFGGLVGIDAAADTVLFYDNSTTGFSWTPVYIAMVLGGGTGQLYMPNNRTNPNGRVLRLNQSNVLGTEIHVEPRRYSFATGSPDNAWVGLAGTAAFLGMVDTSTDTYFETALPGSFPTSRFPIWLPDSSRVFVSSVQSSNTQLDYFDAPSFALAGIFTPFSDNIQRNCIVMSPDGTTIYCAGNVDIAKVDAVTGVQIGSPVALPTACNYLCFLPDGSKLYISTPSGLLPYDTGSDTVGGNVSVGTNAQGMCVKTQ